MEISKRLAEAVLRTAYSFDVEYECNYCGARGEMPYIEHDSDCPVILAQQVMAV